MYSLIGFSLCYKKFGERVALLKGIVLQLIGIAGSTYYNVIAPSGIGAFAGWWTEVFGHMYLFRRWIMVAIAWYVYEYYHQIVTFLQNKKYLIIVLWVLLGALKTDELFLAKEHNLGIEYPTTFLTPIVALCLFCITLIMRVDFPKIDTIAGFMGTASVVIYFTHSFLLSVFNIIGLREPYLRWGGYVLFECICAVILKQLSQLKRLHWLAKFI